MWTDSLWGPDGLEFHTGAFSPVLRRWEGFSWEVHACGGSTNALWRRSFKAASRRRQAAGEGFTGLGPADLHFLCISHMHPSHTSQDQASRAYTWALKQAWPLQSTLGWGHSLGLDKDEAWLMRLGRDLIFLSMILFRKKLSGHPL